MKDKRTRDYAVVGIHRGNIFLEANEWESALGRHFAVTLYLPPEDAMQLAEQINLCALGMQREKETLN